MIKTYFVNFSYVHDATTMWMHVIPATRICDTACFSARTLLAVFGRGGSNLKAVHD